MRVAGREGLQVHAILTAGAFLGAALLIWPVQRRIDTLQTDTAPAQDLLYFGSPSVVESLSLGYRSLLADVYWMRAIQYYGRREEADRRPVRYKNLSTLLDITTTLDPYMIDAYRAGSSFLAEPDPIGAGQPQEAISLLDKGIARHPEDWRLRFDKGFVCFWYLRDFKEAGQIWLKTSKMPGAPPWMEPLAAMSFSRGGALETARSIWQRQYQESDRPDVKTNARNHLLSIQASEDMWTLEFLIGKYQERTGLLPWTLDDLVRSGYLKQVPVDPLGDPYRFNPQTVRVELSPHSKFHYIAMAPVYRQVFMDKLARQYPSR